MAGDNAGTSNDRARTYLGAAKDAGRWVIASALCLPDRRTWPYVVGDANAIDPAVYHGDAGVALFLADLADATGDEEVRIALSDAGRSLIAHSDYGWFGLYSGLAGMAFALNRAATVLDDAELAQGVQRMLDRIEGEVVVVGEGVEWPITPAGRGPWHELYHGTAGIALVLLELGRDDVAVAAGRRLLDLAVPAQTGRWWRSRPDDLKPAPNIAHGTAGVSYALSTLALATGENSFAEAALDGAAYLLSIARTDGGTCAVHHHEVDGTGRYTLGWCSGPPGLACLFLRLNQLTGDETWIGWAQAAARTVTTSGIPAQLYPGFWDNVAQCCGSAGVADFFLGLHNITKDQSHLEFAYRVLDDVLRRAVSDRAGMRWQNVEYTADPPELPAATGYMQGAAGVGSALLRAHRQLSDVDIGPWLPSWPFDRMS